jgi:hypothetical protein
MYQACINRTELKRRYMDTILSNTNDVQNDKPQLSDTELMPFTELLGKLLTVKNDRNKIDASQQQTAV